MMKAVQQIESESGRDAKPQEIAEVMQITIEEYHQLVHETNTCRVMNFVEMEYEDQSFSDTVEDSYTIGPLEGIQRDEFKSHLVEAIKLLPEREQLIVTLYYDEELNLREIGEVLGVSESRVCQIHGQALIRLRARMTEFFPKAKD